MPRAAGADETSLENQHALHAETGQLEGERAAGDAAADDHGIGRPHAGPRSRIGSPWRIVPVLRYWAKLRARRGPREAAARGVRGCTLRVAADRERSMAKLVGSALGWPAACRLPAVDLVLEAGHPLGGVHDEPFVRPSRRLLEL